MNAKQLQKQIIDLMLAKHEKILKGFDECRDFFDQDTGGGGVAEKTARFVAHVRQTRDETVVSDDILTLYSTAVLTGLAEDTPEEVTDYRSHLSVIQNVVKSVRAQFEESKSTTNG